MNQDQDRQIEDNLQERLDGMATSLTEECETVVILVERKREDASKGDMSALIGASSGRWTSQYGLVQAYIDNMKPRPSESE